MLSESELEFFTNEENWRFGPHVDVRFAFGDVQAALDAVDVLISDQIVIGPFSEVSHIGSEDCSNARGEGSSPVRYCVLQDDAVIQCPVGVKYCVRPSYGEWAVLWLAIPPLHTRRLCEHPWRWATNWVTPGGFQLHSLLIELAMRMRKSSKLEHAVIQREDWPYGQSYGQSGIVVHHEIAKTGHWEIADEFETYCLLRFR